MTNASVKNLSVALSVFALGVALSMGAFAITAHADDFGDFSDFGGGWSDFSSYDAGWSDVDTYNPGWSDVDSYNPGWSELDSYNPGYYTEDTYNPGSYTEDTYNPGYYTEDTYNPGYYTEDTYNPGYSDTYYEDGMMYTDSYGSAFGTSYGSIGGITIPRTIIPPSYPIPTPAPIPPAPRPIPYPVPQPTPVPQQNITTVTNNTCTNGSCNDNSINNSFNTAPVIPVVQTPVQVPVQYVFPQPVQNVSCTITAVGNVLSWTSYGATSAHLSDGIGLVALNGTLTVRPSIAQTYVLTVYGPQGQVATCNAFVQQITPSVSLSQIPYTGFDFGPVGNAIYWTAILGFVASLAYLVVYFKGGAAVFASAMVRSDRPAVSAAPVAAPAEREEKRSFLSASEIAAINTKDVMSIDTQSGTPRIVINRS